MPKTRVLVVEYSPCGNIVEGYQVQLRKRFLGIPYWKNIRIYLFEKDAVNDAQRLLTIGRVIPV